MALLLGDDFEGEGIVVVKGGVVGRGAGWRVRLGWAGGKREGRFDSTKLIENGWM